MFSTIDKCEIMIKIIFNKFQDFVAGRLAAGEMGCGIDLENMTPKVRWFVYGYKSSMT